MAKKVRFRRRKARRNMGSRKESLDLSAQRAIARGFSPYVPGSRGAADTTLVTLSLLQNVTSSAGGVIALAVNANPGGYNDWGSYAADYREYRILLTEVFYEPRYNNTFNAALAQNILISYVDRSNTAVPVSYVASFNVASSFLGNTGKRMVRKVKLDGIEDSGFVDTGSPTTVWTYKYYADTLTANTTYGTLFIRALVQFRGRY